MGPDDRGYLERSPRLAGVVSLIDARHDPTALDRRMVGWLAARGIPTLVALTKADRVPRGRRRARLEAAAEALGLDPEQVVWFSSRTGEGRDAVFSAVDSFSARRSRAELSVRRRNPDTGLRRAPDRGPAGRRDDRG